MRFAGARAALKTQLLQLSAKILLQIISQSMNGFPYTTARKASETSKVVSIVGDRSLTLSTKLLFDITFEGLGPRKNPEP